MIGVLIACHKDMSENLLDTASFIIGQKPEKVATFSAELGYDTEKLKLELSLVIGELESGDGVLVLTDILGGTPTSLADDFLAQKNIEVITGVNLPMVIASINYRKEMSLKRLSKRIAKVGKRSIFSLREAM